MDDYYRKYSITVHKIRTTPDLAHWVMDLLVTLGTNDDWGADELDAVRQIAQDITKAADLPGVTLDDRDMHEWRRIAYGGGYEVADWPCSECNALGSIEDHEQDDNEGRCLYCQSKN